MAIRTELRDGNQIEVVGDDFAEVVRVLSPNISLEGVFLETDLWVANGSPVRFRLGLEDGFALVHAMGSVVWRRAGGAEPAGVAIRFDHVVEGGPLIERIVDQHQLEGGRAFRLAGPSSAPVQASPGLGLGPPAADRRAASADASHDAGADHVGGLEILETLQRGETPRLAPGLERGADPDALSTVRLSRDVIASLGGAEPTPVPEPGPTAAEPKPLDSLLDQSVSDVRSLLGGSAARPDVLTSTVSGPPARALDAVRKRRSGTASEPGLSASVARGRSDSPGSRGAPPGGGAAGGLGGIRPDDRRFDENGVARPAHGPRRDGRVAEGSASTGASTGTPAGAAAGAAGRARGEQLYVDASTLEGAGHADDSAAGGEAAEGAAAGAPATDPLISASWLLERWDRIAGEASGPPSEDPALARDAEPVRGGAARARGASGIPFVPLLVLGVILVAAYLAVQRWYLDRPRATPGPARPVASEVAEGTAAGPELDSAGPGRSLSDILDGRVQSDPEVEVADGALDGGPVGVLERVTWDLAPGETRILLEGDGAFVPGAVRHERLAQAPPRELLRIAGILRPVSPPRYDVGSPEVAAVRFGFHQQGTAREAHVVIDLAGPNVRLRRVRLAPGRMVLVLSGGGR